MPAPSATATTVADSGVYSRPARLLHWLVAALVLTMVPAGLIMVRPGLDRPLQDTLFIFHKNAGLVVLVLMLLRIGWRIAVPPPPPVPMPRLQAAVAEAVHGALYVLVLVMALSGYVRVTAGGFPLELAQSLGLPPLVPRSEPLAATAKALHGAVANGLILAVALHLAGAAHHGLIRRDGLLRRMWPR
ncbi:cytochrome b [Frigidibacter oleivorans]|uniref:cytochrome b n=1 Tax=Frigidibacter oleivorans TaxID=2487129 RepID=UPI000F8E08BD|nr:cytochrome b/b6 domain-containing protein [Frigidibacter oleivorans]